MLICLLLAAATFEAKPLDDGSGLMELTVKNDDDKPILVIGEEVIAQRRGKEWVVERVLEVEDLGPIARTPMSPRWQTPKGEKAFGAFLILAKSTVVLKVKDARQVTTAPATKVLALAEQSSSRIEGERREFGKFVPTVRALARYSERKLVKDLTDRPAWDFAELPVSDAPLLASPWPVLVVKPVVKIVAL